MDDKTFMASYVANETTRVKDKLKAMVERGQPPSEEEKAELMQDMHASFGRLQQMILQLQQMVDAEEAGEEAKEKLPV